MFASSDYHVVWTVIATITAIRVCDAVVRHFSLVRQRRSTFVAANIEDTAAINYVDESTDDDVFNGIISAPLSVMQFIGLVAGAIVGSRLYDIVFRSPSDRLEVGSVADVIVTAVLVYNFGIIIGSVLIAVRAHDYLVRLIDETINGGFTASTSSRPVYRLWPCEYSSPKEMCTQFTASGQSASAINDVAKVDSLNHVESASSVHRLTTSTVGMGVIDDSIPLEHLL